MSDAGESELDPLAREIYDLLRRQPGDRFSPQEIAAQLHEDAADVSRQVRELEQRGLITRTAAGDDVRYVLSDAAPEL